MSEKKINLKRILATTGWGAVLVAMLFIAERKCERKLIRTYTGAIPTTLVRDSTDFMALLTDTLNVVEYGNYSPFTDTASTNYFYYTTPIKGIKEATDDLNAKMVFVDYHEVRHAFNRRLMMHFKWDFAWDKSKKTFDMHPDLFVADEISARVAEQLAEIGNMPRLNSGALSPCISYQIDPRYDICSVADVLVRNALDVLKEPSICNTYKEIWRGFGYWYLDSLHKKPTLSKKEIINEIMTFEINGKKQNMLRLASKTTQKEVYEFLNMVKQEEQLWVSSILDEYNRQHKR